MRWDIYMKRVLYRENMKSPLYEEALIWAAIFMGLWHYCLGGYNSLV